MISKLKELRNKTKTSQRTLAKFLNVDQTAISRWENTSDEPNISTLIKIAGYFNISLDYLLGRTEIDIFLSVEEQRQLAEDPLIVVFKGFRSLSDEEQKRMIDYINFLIVAKISQQ